jgi:putative FmdB family regulatory protein
MPIYEYRCMDCRKKFDLLRPMSQSTEPAECPLCKGNARRIASTFMAKGSGGSVGGGGCSSCSTSSCSSCH